MSDKARCLIAVGTLLVMLEMIGSATDYDLAKAFVDAEMDIKALLKFILPALASSIDSK